MEKTSKKLLGLYGVFVPSLKRAQQTYLDISSDDLQVDSFQIFVNFRIVNNRTVDFSSRLALTGLEMTA